MGSVVFLLIAGTLFFYFSRHHVTGTLTPEDMDTVQAVRYFGRTRNFGTQFVRPLLTEPIRANADGTLPDLAHQPLYTIIGGLFLRLTKHTNPNDGHREMVLLSVGTFLAVAWVCSLLSRRLFGGKGGIPALLFLLLGGNALAIMLTPTPAILATLFFTLLLICLFALDRRTSVGEPDRKVSLWWAVGAGVLFALLYLTVYSALLLLPVLLGYLIYVSRRDWRVPLIFLVVALAVCSPFLLRTFRLVRNPFYNARLAEVMMFTDTYPGYSLYFQSSFPSSSLAFVLTHGEEMFKKSGQNLLSLYNHLPSVLGTLVLPLFLGASLTRFNDNRVNRLRGTVYALLGVHLLGLSFFIPANECFPLLLMYAPFVSVLSGMFLLSVIEARNPPRFFGRVAILGWILLAVMPGLTLLLTPPKTQSQIRQVYTVLSNTPLVQEIQRDNNGLLIADAPWEVAYRCDVPALWFPLDSGVVSAVEQRTGLTIRGICLSSDTMERYATLKDASSWVTVYWRVLSVAQVVNNLPATLTQPVLREIRLFYPTQLSSVLTNFSPTPYAESNAASFSLLFLRTTP
jgi:MFS family permease